MRESGIGGPDSGLGSGLGPADEQLVRIETARMTHATGTAVVVTVAREIDLLIVVDHTRPVIRPIQVTGLDEVLALFDTIEEALRVPL
jgi:hypothetical protein